MKNLLSVLFFCICFALSAQDCNKLYHSTQLIDSWRSCHPSTNPNPLRGTSHWIQYDLTYQYALGEIHLWNYNVQGQTGNGMKNLVIDVSSNGVDWTQLGVFQLAEATNSDNYQGEQLGHLGDIEAQFVLLTAIDNWGAACVGLSELRIKVSEPVFVEEPKNLLSIKLFPNPASHSLSIDSDQNL